MFLNKLFPFLNDEAEKPKENESPKKVNFRKRTKGDSSTTPKSHVSRRPSEERIPALVPPPQVEDGCYYCEEETLTKTMVKDIFDISLTIVPTVPGEDATVRRSFENLEEGLANDSQEVHRDILTAMENIIAAIPPKFEEVELSTEKTAYIPKQSERKKEQETQKIAEDTSKQSESIGIPDDLNEETIGQAKDAQEVEAISLVIPGLKKKPTIEAEEKEFEIDAEGTTIQDTQNENRNEIIENQGGDSMERNEKEFEAEYFPLLSEEKLGNSTKERETEAQFKSELIENDKLDKPEKVLSHIPILNEEINDNPVTRIVVEFATKSFYLPNSNEKLIGSLPSSEKKSTGNIEPFISPPKTSQVFFESGLLTPSKNSPSKLFELPSPIEMPNLTMSSPPSARVKILETDPFAKHNHHPQEDQSFVSQRSEPPQHSLKSSTSRLVSSHPSVATFFPSKSKGKTTAWTTSNGELYLLKNQNYTNMICGIKDFEVVELLKTKQRIDSLQESRGMICFMMADKCVLFNTFNKSVTQVTREVRRSCWLGEENVDWAWQGQRSMLGKDSGVLYWAGWPDWISIRKVDEIPEKEKITRISIKGNLKLTYKFLKVFSCFSSTEEHLWLIFESDFTKDKQLLVKNLVHESKQTSVLIQGSKMI